MQRWMCGLLVLSIISCGGGEAGAQEAPATAQEPVPQAPVRQDRPGQQGGTVACPLLEGIVPDLFGAEPEAVTFRPSSFRRQDICRATWAPFDQPNNRYANKVRLTILGTAYDSAEAAVASLESMVTTSGPGSTVKSGSGEWVEGVGDRAIQNETSVQVAAKARRFTVSASLTDDPARNQKRTLELARRLADRM
jgi:hypothetical protein